MDNDFDFGFTAVDELELESVQQLAKQTQVSSQTVQDLEEKLDRLYNAILPLLSNLKKNPEKEYIYWPNRAQKMNDFITKVKKIVNS